MSSSSAQIVRTRSEIRVIQTLRYSTFEVYDSSTEDVVTQTHLQTNVVNHTTDSPRTAPRRKQAVVIKDEKEKLRILSQLRAIGPKTQMVTSSIMKDEFDAGEVLEDSIWVGSLQATRDVQNLKRLNITSILTTARGLKVEVEEGMRHRVVLMEDHPAEDLLGKLGECFDFLQEELASNRRVLVHCASGVSRSVSVCVAYLVVHRKWNVKASLELIRKNRGFANPNVGFFLQLTELEAQQGDFLKAREVYQKRTRGKPITESLIQWRSKANLLHQKVDSHENRIKSSTVINPETAREWMEQLKWITGEANSLLNECTNDRVSEMMLKSITSKSERLQADLESFLG